MDRAEFERIKETTVTIKINDFLNSLAKVMASDFDDIVTSNPILLLTVPLIAVTAFHECTKDQIKNKKGEKDEPAQN